MVLNNIDRLIEKYENGETNLEEERQLKAYFSKDDIAPHLEVYRPLFAYFNANQAETLSKDISKMPLKKQKHLNYKWLSIAAVAVLMLGFYFKSTQQTNTIDNDLGSIQDPELAYIEVTQALELISKSFNKGTATMNYLDSYQKGIATVGYIAELEQSTNLIFKSK